MLTLLYAFYEIILIISTNNYIKNTNDVRLVNSMLSITNIVKQNKSVPLREHQFGQCKYLM